MNPDIKKLDEALDVILTRPLQGMTQFLTEQYTTDELHIMQRLLRQRGYQDHAHLISLMHLAEKMKYHF